ncbi:MAG TPA: CHASE3 domain-containing protein, partial [Caldimonas sp.]|nr:CHASE3 domain-containing protein [Caldimonas sp.]
MARRVGRIVMAAAAIGAAVLVGNAAVSVYHTAALRHESAAVLHSNELLLALDNVLSLVKDAESGQRGYVITGRAEYLGPYREAVASIQAQMDALERLAREDPEQQRLMAEVRRRVGAKLGELELTVGLRDRKGFDLTRDVISLGAGRAEMEALRATAAEMARNEAQHLTSRQAEADATYRAALVSEALALVAALAALIGFSIVLVRHLRA